MNPTEQKLIRQTLKGFVDNGVISESTMKQIENIKQEDGKPAKSDELITRKEAMGILKVSQQTLINYQKYGKLKAHKIAGVHLVRYRRSDIEDLCR